MAISYEQSMHTQPQLRDDMWQSYGNRINGLQLIKRKMIKGGDKSLMDSFIKLTLILESFFDEEDLLTVSPSNLCIEESTLVGSHQQVSQLICLVISSVLCR
jgi:hypothetical protein